MLTSLVDSSRCATVKKRVYMPRVADEYNSSSQPLNAVVLASILSMVTPPYNSKKLRQGYIVDIAREGGVSPCALMLGLLYIKRLSHSNPDYVRIISPRDLFLISMVVASKYMNDEGEMEALTNSDWAKLGCMTKATLDELERNFLSAIDWKLYVPLEEYYTFVNSIEARIALDQASKRGWFTYTDLTAVWEATDISSSMMFATKQTAKVATKGAALYLMCVATLFAASGTLPLTQDLSLQLFSTSNEGTGQLSPQAANYLGHSPAPPTVQQSMFVDDHCCHAVPNFDMMDTVHRKKKASNRLALSRSGSEFSGDRIFGRDRAISMSEASTCTSTLHSEASASTPQSSFLLVGGSGQADHSSRHSELKTGTSKRNDSSNEYKETSLADSPSPYKKKQTVKNTWTKLEDGFMLLLNLVASISLSSAAKSASSNSSGSHPAPSPSHTPNGPESLPNKQSYNSNNDLPSLSQIGPSTVDVAMGSETTNLSTVLIEHSSCRDYRQNALWNVAAHWWWDGGKPQACLVDGSLDYLATAHNPHVAPRRKHNATMHYSQYEAVSMDTVNRCTCCASESAVAMPPSLMLNAGQVAVDLHWPSGGTGDQSIANPHFVNYSTPLSGDWTNFTLTENLLLYANSLLTMAF